MWGAKLRTPPNLRVVKALASPIRAQILGLLARGPMSYTELMRSLGLSPDRDAGKFAYHLKTLVKAGLVKPNRDGGYEITDLGRIAHGMMEGLEERLTRRRRMVVRTSRLAIEEFDRSKIAESLVREADVPSELASRIAREAEEKLSMIRVRYLTAPLIRELVNAILLEKGLEEYRHKMTRVGLPVYDVCQLLSSSPSWAVREKACDRVLEEYALIGVLHRDVADAHLSGSFHIEDLRHWGLGPSAIFHDARPFLSGAPAAWPMAGPGGPEDLGEALTVLKMLLSSCYAEVRTEQVLPFFNFFLAPFLRSRSEAERELRRFLLELAAFSSLGKNHIITIGLELSVPDHLARTVLPGPGGAQVTCGEVDDEALELADITLDVLARMSVPLAGLVLHAPKGCDEELMAKAHALAAGNSSPIFLLADEPAVMAFDGSALRPDWTGDWELDLLRVGRIGRVVLNLPRLAYRTGDLDDFLLELRDLVEMAIRASVQRRSILGERARRRLMPGVMAEIDGDSYMRMPNSAYPVSFVGLPEACLVLSGELPHEGREGLRTALKVLEALGSYLEAYSSRADVRCPLSSAVGSGVAERMAVLDVERFGWSKVRVLGPREEPVYTAGHMTPPGGLDLGEALELEALLHQRTPGGHIFMAVPEGRPSAEELLGLTEEARRRGVRAISYPSEITYCSACSLSFRGSFPKCPSCGRVSTVVRLVRTAEGYVREPLGVKIGGR